MALLSLFQVFVLSLLFVKPEPTIHCPVHRPPLWHLSLLLLCHGGLSSLCCGSKGTCYCCWNSCSLVFCDNYVQCEPLRVWMWDHILFTVIHSFYPGPNSVMPLNGHPNTNPSRVPINAFSKILIKLSYLFPPQPDHHFLLPGYFNSLLNYLSASILGPIQVIPPAKTTRTMKLNVNHVTLPHDEVPHSDTETKFWAFHSLLSHLTLYSSFLSPYSSPSSLTCLLSVSQTGPHLSLLHILFFLPGMRDHSSFFLF